MVGDPEDEQYKGIIPRSFDYLFQRIRQYKEKDFYEISGISLKNISADIFFANKKNMNKYNFTELIE